MATTGFSQTTPDKGQTRIKKGTAPRILRDNDRDDDHNAATQQESRDLNERAHFRAAATPDIERPQASVREQSREKSRTEKRAHDGGEREYNHSDRSHYNDDDRTFQRFTGSGGNRSASNRYEKVGHGANRRPDDGYGDPMNEVDPRYLQDTHRRDNDHYNDRSRNDYYSRGDRPQSGDRYNGHGRYNDRDYNDRQNGWQANGRPDNRDDARFNNNWQDRQWRETAQRDDPRDWRPNDDHRNEQRNGSEPDRDRGSYGNSRFRDDDYGYRSSQGLDRDYGHDGNPSRENHHRRDH